MKKIIGFLLPLFLALPGFHVTAQDDHGHTHDAPAPGASPETNMFILYAESQKYELTLKHGELEPGKPAELTLYIADFATNRPIENVELKVSVQEDPNLAFTTDPHEPGVYHIDGTFPKAQGYSLALNLNSVTHGADLLLLQLVEVGKKLPHLAEALDTQGDSSRGIMQWLIYALIFLGGLAVGGFLLQRKPKALAILVIGMSIPLSFQQAHAHEGHDDEKEATAGNSVYIPKETQFLFDLTTQRIDHGSFQPSLEFYGTVVPASGGFANIISPQNGRITSLKVSPGQKVTAGQVVAILKPTANQSEQVNIATETGRLQVEIRAAQSELATAEKELDRLQAIADIAAKKDVQAAEARVQSAKANLQALQLVAGGSVANATSDMTLKAPIAGTVGQFTLAAGSEVSAGTSLFTIINLSSVFIEAQVYDRDAAIVNNAEKYNVTCNDADHRTAEVRMVSAAVEVNQTNQSQKVLFELQNPDAEFKIGEFVTLHAFQQATNKSIFVPNSSLSEINGKPVVFVKDAPESYSVRYISLGQDNGSHTTILKGLEEGERFVTSATYQVKMMMLNQ